MALQFDFETHTEGYETALRLLREHKVGLLIVAYDAERHIRAVLERIPRDIAALLKSIFVIDDSSSDPTYEAALEAGRKLELHHLTVFRTPSNRGYGGNQKIGYTHAIERGLDFVVLLHGDGQYPPERLPQMIAPFADPRVDVVLGSRMLNRTEALRGRMPFYKWVGNQVLTKLENLMLGVQLSEFHTGYRAFRVAALRRIPFRHGSDDFHFDTQILIQFLSAGSRITEVPIPTHYGDEVCHVNGLRYARECAKAVVKYRLFTMGLLYDPLLDFDLFETENYYLKKDPRSLHQFVLRLPFGAHEHVLELGAAAGYVSAVLSERVERVVAIDHRRPRRSGRAEALAFDLDGDFDSLLGPSRFDAVLALDVLEHLASPEAAMQKIARVLKPGGRVLASTANIAFFPMRCLLLLGVFNYGKRGILDMTHRRLFTVSSFRRLFRMYGFEIEAAHGFGPPIRDMISRRFPFSVMDSALSLLARWMPRLFSYNVLIVARRKPTLEEVYEATVRTAAEPEGAAGRRGMSASPRQPSAVTDEIERPATNPGGM